MTSHYDSRYFEWQRPIGEFGGRANLFKFRAHVRPTDNVLEFGCGGGYLLANLDCAARVGIEVNSSAVQEAARQGLTCYATADSVPDGWADVIISNSALEHTLCPLDELRRLYPKLRPGGKLVCSVPCESPLWSYAAGDINQHLYTWSPMSLGNLLTTAGFSVVRVDVHRLFWPPFSPRLLSILGESAFRVVCRVSWVLRAGLNFVRPSKTVASICAVATR